MGVSGVGGHWALNNMTMPFFLPTAIPRSWDWKEVRMKHGSGQQHMMRGIAFNKSLRIMLLKDSLSTHHSRKAFRTLVNYIKDLKKQNPSFAAFRMLRRACWLRCISFAAVPARLPTMLLKWYRLVQVTLIPSVQR